MSLDIHIDPGDGTVGEYVSIGADAHDRLMSIASAHPLIQRLHDFYGDAEYAAAELDALERELVTLEASAVVETDLLHTLAELRRVLVSARAQGHGLLALAD